MTILSVYEEKYVTKYGPADAPLALLRVLRSAQPGNAFGFYLTERDENGDVYLDYGDMLIQSIKEHLVNLSVERFNFSRGHSRYASDEELVSALHSELRGHIGVVSLSSSLRQEPTADFES